jgi:chaperone BCS1
MIVKFDLADEGMIAAIFRAIFAPLKDDEAAAEKAVADPEAVKRLAAEEAKKREEIVARVDELAVEFSAKIPAHEFSPAEIQGYLLKNKRDPEKAVAGAGEWVVVTRKEKQEKQLKEAEEKREEEARKKKEKEEAEKKRKEEEEKKAKKAAKKKKKKAEKKKERKSKRGEDRDGSSDSDSSDSSSSESEGEAEGKSDKIREAAAEKSESGKTAETAVKDLSEEGKNGGDSGYGTP